jgi:hypothetical protein
MYLIVRGEERKIYEEISDELMILAENWSDATAKYCPKL